MLAIVRAIAWLVFGGVIATTSAAHGQGAPPPEPERSWYGWQTMIPVGTAYAGAVALVALKETREGWPFAALLGVALLSGPTVHLAHGEGIRAAGSLGLNLGLPLAGGLLGAAVVCAAQACSGKGNIGFYAGFFMGGVLGLVAANVIDISVLSFDQQPASAAAPSTSSRLGVSPAPFVISF